MFREKRRRQKEISEPDKEAHMAACLVARLAATHPRGASMRAVSRACSNWTASTPNKRGALHVLLDLASDVSFSEAKAAFQQKAKRCHPDLAASTGRSASSLQTEFVALQTAWENYLASLEGASSAAEVAAKREQEKHLEMVLLILRMSSTMLSRGLLQEADSHRIRNAVIDAVRMNGQKAFGKAFPPANVRRVQYEESRGNDGSVHVHIHAMNVKHRDSVVELFAAQSPVAGREPPCDAFLRSLRTSFADYGGCADDLLGLQLAAGYTMEPVPPPANGGAREDS